MNQWYNYCKKFTNTLKNQKTKKSRKKSGPGLAFIYTTTVS